MDVPWAGFLLIIHTGCATSFTQADGPSVILPVPAYRQEVNRCGPAALAAIYRYWDVPESESAVAARIFNDRKSGTLPIMLVADARGRGFQAAFGRSDKAGLLDALENRIPVVCLIEDSGVPHLAVVHGYRMWGVRRDLLVEYGRGRSQWIAIDRWEKRWRTGNFLSFYIWPNGHEFDPPPLMVDGGAL